MFYYINPSSFLCDCVVGSSKDEDSLRRKVAEQIVTIERLERDRKDTNEKLTQLEAHSKKYGEFFVSQIIDQFLKSILSIQRMKWPA